MFLKPEQTEHWIQVACWLPDCLVWAGHRLDGRISGACLEARNIPGSNLRNIPDHQAMNVRYEWVLLWDYREDQSKTL